jgi:predicted TIM-barrel fold metal-dependent hydrolase
MKGMSAMPHHSRHIVTGADIRAKLNHPVVDADGHMIETTFAVLDFVKQVGGPEIAARYEKTLRSDHTGRSRSAVWVGNSGPASIDRATAMLPKLMRARLDEAGIDFAVVYGTHALTVLRLEDDELRPVVYRAMNLLYADMFKEVSDRLTPVALIPMHTPEEALAELDFAVAELGHKVIVMNIVVRRPAPEVVKEAPHLASYSMAPTSPGIDVGDDYDAVWARCVELGVAPSCHNAVRGRGTTHGSPSNYVFNSLGSFAQGSDYFCRALFFGGVPRRFPTLKFAFLEGGAGWAAQLYNNLFEYWEKRNLDALARNLDPAKLDVDLLVQMFEKYGNDYLTPERIRAEPHQPLSSQLFVAPEEVNDFALTGVEKPEDIRAIFDHHFYFGSEADDRMTAVAFDTKLNHYGARMNAILGSDIGHWDVPDMTQVMVEAYEMVERGYMTEADFRDFTFANVVRMHTGMNPNFFKGTVVEDAVEALKAERSVLAAE